MADKKLVQVAAAVIENDSGKILIAKRPQHVHQGGLWEFPGGKIENNESIESALFRELNEELGIQPRSSQPLIQITHHYPDKSVMLHVRRVYDYAGKATGNEGQEIQWVNKNALQQFQFPAANQPIITAAQLPDKYLITPDHPLEQRAEFLTQLKQKITDGIDLIQLRAKNLSDQEYFQLYEQVQTVIAEKNIKLLLNTSLENALKLDADGAHLTARRLMQTHSLPKNLLVAASCHNRAEIEKACTLGVQFIVLSPVAVTASHPDTKPLGWAHFARLCQLSTIPVFALGGMKLSDITTAQAHGAQGISAISSIWRNR